jgi:hypothetical protein
VSADWVVRYGNRLLQLERQSQHYAPARSKVLVCEGRDGSLRIEYRGQKLGWREIRASNQPTRAERRPARAETTRRKWAPAGDHPWRQYPQRRPADGPTPRSAPALTSPCASP